MQATAFTQFTGLSTHGAVVRATTPSAAAAPVARVSLNIEAKQVSRKARNQARHRRQRSKINGTPEQPRLAVYRSNEHIYAQVIDDVAQRTLAATSSLSPAIREGIESGANVDAASKVGEHIAELCLAKDINKVVFDRGGFLYHGRVQALADSAREKGLVF